MIKIHQYTVNHILFQCPLEMIEPMIDIIQALINNHCTGWPDDQLKRDLGKYLNKIKGTSDLLLVTFTKNDFKEDTLEYTVYSKRKSTEYRGVIEV